MPKQNYIPGRSGQNLAPEDRRSRQQVIRLSAGERDYLHLMAKEHGMQVAEYIRACVFTGQVRSQPPEANKAKWAELSRLASNLNQLARAYNAGFEVTEEELTPLLKDTLAELKMLRDALLGISTEGA